METFRASVQYNDLQGSTAADNASHGNATDWLKDNGHITADEYLLGFSMFIGTNHDSVSVTFLVSELNGYKNIPEMIDASIESIQAKKISIDMGVADFFSLFKRLNITLSSNGLMEGQDYRTE